MALRIETRTLQDDVDIICSALVKEIINAKTWRAKLDAAEAIFHVRKMNEKCNMEACSLIEASMRARLNDENKINESSTSNVAGTGKMVSIKTKEDLYYGKR